MTAQKGTILGPRPHRPGLARKALFGLLLLFLPPMAVVTAFGIAPGTAPADVPLSLVREPLEMPEMVPAMEQAPRYVSQEKVLRGDTVAALFDRLGVSDPKAIDFLKADPTGRMIFRQLVPGRMLQAETGNDGELLALPYFTGPPSLLEVNRAPAGLKARQCSTNEPP